MEPIKERLCIRVPKVYDWVNREVELPVSCHMGKHGFDNLDFDFHFDLPEDTDPYELDFLSDTCEASCMITDSSGNPVDHNCAEGLEITEVLQSGGRPEVTVTLPDGECVTLQRVKVLVRGYYVVRILDEDGDLCYSAPQPFATIQTFFLCAPEGTELIGHITFADCHASIISDPHNCFQQLDVCLTLCLDIQMEAYVKIEVEGKFCDPRPDIDIVTNGSCPVKHAPPQCPEIFPGYSLYE